MTDQKIIEDMRQRISNLGEQKELLESEIREKVREWREIAQSVYDGLCNNENVESFDSEVDLVELADEIQELKEKFNSLEEEIVEAKVFDEWYISESYVSAIENTDFSGLEEAESVQDFINKIADYSPNFCLVWGEESEFEHCHISGQRASCLLAKLVLVG